MNKTSKISPICMLFVVLISASVWAQETPFPWPDGNKMALSLSFDDARASNPVTGIPLLNKHGILATFFVLPEGVESNLKGWKMAAAQGHEMANHSFVHPCSGNFTWSREKALENYTADRMEKELLEANQVIYDLLGVQPAVYAYPCGQKYFASGRHTQSLVPLIAEHFLAGRGWLDEAVADPWYVDMAQLPGIKMDDTDFEALLPMIKQSSENGHWLILAGHETGTGGPQTTRLEFLEKLAIYITDPANKIWVEWSVSDQEAGKEFLVSVSSQNLQGNAEKTGSWETFQQKHLGILRLDKGYQRLTFKSANPAVEGPLLDIRKISLVPVQ